MKEGAGQVKFRIWRRDFTSTCYLRVFFIHQRIELWFFHDWQCELRRTRANCPEPTGRMLPGLEVRLGTIKYFKKVHDTSQFSIPLCRIKTHNAARWLTPNCSIQYVSTAVWAKGQWNGDGCPHIHRNHEGKNFYFSSCDLNYIDWTYRFQNSEDGCGFQRPPWHSPNMFN